MKTGGNRLLISVSRHVSAAVAALALCAVTGTAYAQQFVSISNNVANVRAQPTTRSEKLWELNRGYPLAVTKRQGSWLKVRDFEGDLGWIYRPLTGNTPHHVVRAKVANLRAAPQTSARLVGKLEQYELLKTVGKRNGWVHVKRNNGQQGWVAQRLVWGW
ncbi:peptide-binding protein [Imbroritus primus]|uniref:Peptide-binding protein n=1 Tax=Imbroritus primus TaxID=3058603 RepID=A0ACD3SMH1_9BURK|nr:peptide-binding protein [Burkholderiaceae bacterium PBA]